MRPKLGNLKDAMQNYSHSLYEIFSGNISSMNQVINRDSATLIQLHSDTYSLFFYSVAGARCVLHVDIVYFSFLTSICFHPTECECYDHADSCAYNGTLGYGVCQNCKHNTTGLRCNECQDKFYRNMNVPVSSPNTCLGKSKRCQYVMVVSLWNHAFRT